MFRLSDNYHLRKCFFEREQVPTQSVMIKTMSPPLASVYFKSMTPKLKVLAGLEPPMKGGGNDWYIPPKCIIEEGRVVMKPIKNEYLKKLGFNGISFFGDKLIEDHHRHMAEEKKRVLLENDLNWKSTIEVSCRQQWEDSSKEAAKHNSEKIQNAFREFSVMYTKSITQIETILFDAAIKEIQETREQTFNKMKAHYEDLLDRQAKMLYDRYTKKLDKEKAKLKANFINKVETSRTVMGNQIHDINIEKHIVVEKLRQLLECMNLACQVYVALKEREQCKKEMELSQHEHKKKVKVLKEEIALKDFEIRLAQEKERKRLEFNRIWKKKMCQVVKKFQMFVSFCLNTLPEHADFFIDIEKLMMLQVNESVENPVAESIFEPDDIQFHTPVAKPHPFYLCCDTGYKPDVDQDLCPKHCTSSATQMPVVVVNKHCIYAACDNFEKFTDKIAQYIHGRRGDDIDFHDDRPDAYQYNIPVEITPAQQLLELRLESSLLQILQEELPNVKEVPLECCVCRIPYCFCSPLHASKISLQLRNEEKKVPSLQSIPSGTKIETRSVELEHDREPKWESYMDFMLPRKCRCGKTAKKHLEEHIPPYMRNMSIYEEPQIPNYEKCTVQKLQKMVKKAQKKRPPPPPPKRVESTTREVATQYSNQEFDFLCTCFSDDEIAKLFKELAKSAAADEDAETFQMVGDDISHTYLTKSPSLFATECAFTLKNLLDESPQLEEIFKKKDCHY